MSVIERKQEKVKKLAKQQKIGMMFGCTIGKRRKNLVDRLLVAIAARLSPPGDPAKSFMRDEICDAEPEFSLAELQSFRGQRDS
jgi:hypothetical protein